MTNEQKEAIEYLERQIRVCNENAEICDNNNFDEEATHLREESYMLHTALSLIKEQQEEIEKLKNKEVLIKRYFKKCDLIKQKDKQIDLMARRILIYQMYNSNLIEKICNECGYEDCCDEISQDCIKKYFETKAKKGE